MSTLSGAVPGGVDAFRRWPAPHLHRGPSAVVLVCRTHVQGLQRARAAVQQWQESCVPPGVRLAGLVAVADAPGARLPRPQADLLRLVDGGLAAILDDGPTPTRLWTVPWVPELRSVRSWASLPVPPALVRIATDLHPLLTDAGADR